MGLAESQVDQTDTKISLNFWSSASTWNHRPPLPCLVFCAAGIQHRASCILDRHSTNWAISPAPEEIVLEIIDNWLLGTQEGPSHCVTDWQKVEPRLNSQILHRFCSPDCLWIYSVSRDDLEFLLFLPVSPNCWDYRHVSPYQSWSYTFVWWTRCFVGLGSYSSTNKRRDGEESLKWWTIPWDKCVSADGIGGP